MKGSMLEQVKGLLRITSEDFDFEIEDLIMQAIEDLIASGLNPLAINQDIIISINDVADIDPNIRRCICLYCKAYFGLDNPDKDWFINQYLYKKAELLNQKTQYVDNFSYEEPSLPFPYVGDSNV